MVDIRTAAVAFAALELVPGEPSDLSALLSDGMTRQALADRAAAHAGDGLLAYLCAELDHGRVESWVKRLDRLVADGEGVPVLAGDADYPAALAQCWDQPPVLSVRGRLAVDLPAVAVIGSRTADDRTVAATVELAGAAVRGGFSVVSGLAAGVDTAAHEGALDERGHTIAVLGTGICRVFPEQNRSLAARIGESGALLSQFAPDAPRTSTTFLRRNCVIAGVAAASVVMDGAERSGSRHQAEQAVRYSRPVLLWAPALAGRAWARRLVTDGAASFVEDAGQAVALARRAHDDQAG
jgi:DNA processing protein